MLIPVLINPAHSLMPRFSVKIDLPPLVSRQTGLQIIQSATCLQCVFPSNSSGQYTELVQNDTTNTAVTLLCLKSFLMQSAAACTSGQQ